VAGHRGGSAAARLTGDAGSGPSADVAAPAPVRNGNHRHIVRVRCDFCGAEYDTAVSRSALSVVNRCDRCGLSQLSPVEDDERPRAVKAGDEPHDERQER
jgi:hypothetical protein